MKKAPAYARAKAHCRQPWPTLLAQVALHYSSYLHLLVLQGAELTSSKLVPATPRAAAAYLA